MSYLEFTVLLYLIISYSIVAASLIATPVEGYDSEAIRDKARSNGMIPIIPKRANAKKTNPYFDRYLYKLRHLVENMFARLKHFRSIATRYEKLAPNFKSMLYLASTIIHCKMN